MSAATTPTPASRAGAGSIPIVFGVTGHRHLNQADEAALAASLEEVFRRVAERYPDSPQVLLSPLAEGADQLAARSALERGARLIVPLPMPVEAYLETFSSEPARQAFRELSARAEHVFVVPQAAEHEARGGQEPARAGFDYALTGAWLVNHCHLLLALWDGEPDRGEGGTAQVVEWKLVEVPETYLPGHDPLLPGEAGMVVHFRSPRPGEQREGAAGDWRCIPPLDWDGEHAGHDLAQHLAQSPWSNQDLHDSTLERIDAFNHEAARAPDEATAARRLLPAEEEPADLGSLHRVFLDADRLAVQHQGRSKRVLIALLALVAGAALCYEWAAGIQPDSLGAVAGFLGLFAAAFLVHRLAGRSQWEERYLEFRALAEGLRVQTFWALAGVPPAPPTTTCAPSATSSAGSGAP